MEQVKPIILTYDDGREYTLEFSRASVMYAEQRGFSINDIADRGMTRTTELFFYAFRMHHPKMTKQQTDNILFNDLGGLTEEAFERLLALYDAPFGTLVMEDEDGKNSRAKVHL